MRRSLLLVLVCLPAVSQFDFPYMAHETLKIKASERQFMGAVLIAQNGVVKLERPYGYADAAARQVNSTDYVYRLGSVSKMFTAAAVLQLAQQDKLKLTDPIKKYYPDAPPAWDKITLHHLLSHTSGIVNFMTVKPFAGKLLNEPVTPNQLVEPVRNEPLKFEPGTKWAYSNTGYILLGMVIESVSGMKYGDYMREKFFLPIGMKHSGFWAPKEGDGDRLPQGYLFSQGRLIDPPELDGSVAYAASGIYSSVRDLYLWDQALYTESPLKKEWRDKMLTGYMDNPIEGKYGYGWYISDFHGKLRQGHEGSVSGYSASVARYPETKSFVVLLSNLQTDYVGGVADNLARLLFGLPQMDVVR